MIDATSVGHDLTRGTAEFTRAFGDAALSGDADAGDGALADGGAEDGGAEASADDPDGVAAEDADAGSVEEPLALSA